MKQIKNNKGLESAYMGIVIIFMMVTVIGLFFDNFISTVAKDELQQVVQMAELYSLVGSVDLDNARNNDLFVDSILAKKLFNEQVNKHLKTGAGTYFKSFKILKISYRYNKDGASFVDKNTRQYVTCSALIEYETNKTFSKNGGPVKTLVETRIVLYEGLND